MLGTCEGPQLIFEKEISGLNQKLPKALPIRRDSFADQLNCCTMERSMKEEEGFIPLNKDPEAIRHARVINAIFVISEEALR